MSARHGWDQDDGSLPVCVGRLYLYDQDGNAQGWVTFEGLRLIAVEPPVEYHSSELLVPIRRTSTNVTISCTGLTLHKPGSNR